MSVDVAPGERLHNTHWENKFTCPNCLADHELHVPQDQSRLVDCGCGARLRCKVDWVPEAVCIIADPDSLEGDDFEGEEE